ncbi:MAG: hypothetical protein ACI8ZQ_001376 [Bacteroidia bacterium]|jgi:hypothetical protein
MLLHPILHTIKKQPPDNQLIVLKWFGEDRPIRIFSPFPPRRIPNSYILLRYLAKMIFLYSLPTPDLNHFTIHLKSYFRVNALYR